MNCKLASVLLLAAATAGAAVPADFRATRTLFAVYNETPHLAELRLDAAICADTRPDFPDLRLFNLATSNETPRAVQPLFTTRERITRTTILAQATELRELPGNRIDARFDLAPDTPAATGLTIHTPLKDFIRSVRISGSDDGQFWHPLAEAEIFDYSRFMDLRRADIALPPNNCRHFSIEINNASEQRAQPLIHLVQANGQDQRVATDLLQTPFRISGVEFWQETSVLANDDPVLQEWPHAGLKVGQNRYAHTTEITLDTRGAPVTRLDLETSARNFNRVASVQVPAVINGRNSWRTIADGIVSCIDLPGFATNRLSVSFPEQRVPQLRLIIQNTDNPALDITAVRPYGPVYRLLWLADPGANYFLAYGNEQLPAPDYDLAAIRTALEKGIPADLWHLAPAPAPAPRPSGGLGAFLARPAVFGTLLGLAALALLALLARALRKAA